ncbi:MAG: hypothetical protein WBG01_01785 [Bacteroidota bacterium]
MTGLILAFMLLLGSTDAKEIALRSSRTGEFQVSVTVSGEAKMWPEINLWQAVVQDRNGRTLYQIAKEVPFDSPFPSIVLSDSGGSSVLVDAVEGWVEFYDGTGALLKNWEVFLKGEPNYERSINCSVAGDRAAFLLSGTGGRPASVYLTDMRGESLMRISLDQSQAGELHLSDDASVIVAGCYSSGEVSSFTTFCINSDGKVLLEIPILFRTARLSPDRKSLLLAGRRDLLEVALDSQERQTLWTGTKKDELITDVCYVGPFRALLVERVDLSEGVPLYTERDLLVVDAVGNPRMKRRLDGVSETPGSLTVEGETLKVSTGSGTVEISLTE